MIQTLEDMLRMCVIDFGGQWDWHLPLIKFAYNNIYHTSIDMAPYKALYGRKYRFLVCWEEVGDRRLADPELIQITSERVPIIKEFLKTAFSRQKSYTDSHRRHMEFGVGEYVFIKVSPMKGIMRFGKKGKLAPRYVEPFEIVDRVGEVAYHLALSPEFSHV